MAEQYLGLVQRSSSVQVEFARFAGDFGLFQMRCPLICLPMWGDAVPPMFVAVVKVLQRIEGLSDQEAVERLRTFDARWKYTAGGLDFDYPGFVYTVLVDLRARLAARGGRTGSSRSLWRRPGRRVWWAASWCWTALRSMRRWIDGHGHIDPRSSRLDLARVSTRMRHTGFSHEAHRDQSYLDRW